MRNTLWLFGMLLFSGCPVHGLEKATDHAGNDLPAGVRARFGSLRLQHGAPVDALLWTSDGKSILAQTSAREKGGLIWIELWLWNAATGALERQQVVTREYHGPSSGIPHVDQWEVSPDTKYLLTCNTIVEKGKFAPSPLRVTEIRSGKVVFEHVEPIALLGFGPFAQFAPDSKTLLDIHGPQVFDIATGKSRKLQADETKTKYRTAQYSPNGQLVLVTDLGRAPEIWRLGAPTKILRLPPFLEKTSQSAFSPDSGKVALATMESEKDKSRLFLVDTATGKVAKDFGDFHAEPERLLFSPDGTQLAVFLCKPSRQFGANGWQDTEETMHRWDLATGKKLPPLETHGNYAVCYSPDSKTLAIAHGDTIRLLDNATGRELRRIQLAAPLANRRRDFMLLRHYMGNFLAFSPDGKKLAVAVDRTIRLFNVATGNEIGPTPISQAFFAVSAAKEGRWLAACTLQHVDVWDGAKNTLAFRVQPWTPAGKSKVSFTSAVLSADGSRLAIAGNDGRIDVLEVPSGKKVRQLDFHTAPVTSLAFAPDAGTLISADIRGATVAWNLANGVRLRTQAVPNLPIKGPWQIVPDSDGEPIIKDGRGISHERYSWPTLSASARLLTIQDDDNFKVFDLESRKVRNINLENAFGARLPASISAEGQILAVPAEPLVNAEPLIRLLDIKTGKELRSVAGMPSVAQSCFSPDGKWLIVCGDKGIRIWETATGTLKASRHGHRGAVGAIAFSPDGSTLLSAGADGTILAWDIAALLARAKK